MSVSTLISTLLLLSYAYNISLALIMRAHALYYSPTPSLGAVGLRWREARGLRDGSICTGRRQRSICRRHRQRFFQRRRHCVVGQLLGCSLQALEISESIIVDNRKTLFQDYYTSRRSFSSQQNNIHHSSQPRESQISAQC